MSKVYIKTFGCQMNEYDSSRMADVLKAKGYNYQFVFAEGAGHVARPVVAATMAEAMEWLWQGYEAK